MNSGMERYKKKRLAVSVITVSVLIILIQFIDSYCTEIFGRTQSLSARTFLIIPTGMDGDSAIAYMSRMMLPFYFIGMLTPFVRSYTDIIGRKRMLIINVSLLMAGSVICIFAENLPVYLLGNGVLILGYSLDIHMIYIVDAIDRRHRATVRGICGGVSMAAAMYIPLLRSRCVRSDGGNWQILFLVGIVGGMLCLTLVTAYRFPENGADDIQNAMEDGEAICKVSAVKETFGDENRALEAEKHGSSDKENDKHIHFIRTLGTLWRQPDTKGLLIGISAVGLATAGITYYNEPMCAFSGMGEHAVNTVLLVQPVITYYKCCHRSSCRQGAAHKDREAWDCLQLRVRHGIHAWSRSHSLGIAAWRAVGMYAWILFLGRGAHQSHGDGKREARGQRKGIGCIYTCVWHRRSARYICNKSGRWCAWNENYKAAFYRNTACVSCSAYQAVHYT